MRLITTYRLQFSLLLLMMRFLFGCASCITNECLLLAVGENVYEFVEHMASFKLNRDQQQYSNDIKLILFLNLIQCVHKGVYSGSSALYYTVYIHNKR